MAGNFAENISHYLNKLASFKYLPALVIFILAGQVVALASNSFQMFITPKVTSHHFYSPPEYKENFYGEAGWSWSNYKNLYGEIEKKKVAPSINLAITLLGILNFGERGFAMMKVDNGKETLYGLGDNIKNNIKLKSIGIDSVTLSDGNSEKKYGLTAKKSNIFLKRVEAPKSNNLITANAAPVKHDIQVSSLPPVSRNKITNFEKKFQENPLAASNGFEAQPINKEGKVYGYKVSYRVDPALLRSIGLLPTDIILSVNDIPVAKIASNSGILNSLMKEKKFKIVYERGGIKNTLNINR